MARPARIGKKILVKTIENNFGVINRVAKELKCSLPAVYYNLDKYKLRDFVEEVRGRTMDLALDTVTAQMGDVDVALKYMAIVSKTAPGQGLKVNIDDKGAVEIIVETAEQRDKLSEFLNDDK